MNVRNTIRFVGLLSLFAALVSLALAAGFSLAAPLSARLGSGQPLALRLLLRAMVPPAVRTAAFRAAGIPANLHRGPDGRFIYDKSALAGVGMMRSGALRRPRIGTANAQVNEAVQTFDVFNPPPAFTPTQGPSLTPTNLTPVWTTDETMLVFSSNRSASGAAGNRFHLWAIPVNGGTPVQLTDSSGPSGGGEFFPALSAGNNQRLAFTSDAGSTAGVQNLYVINFTAATVNVATQVSPTLAAGGSAVTGFSTVQRPTFSSSDSDEIIFSALSTAGTYSGHYHLYYLYLTSGGYLPVTASLPAKITDGPADDTDPAYSQDGQLIAFSSTSATVTPTNSAPSSDPNTSLLLTASPGPNRGIFLVGGGGRIGFANVTNPNPNTGAGLPVTAPGADNFGPAWSSTRRNPYLNPAPGAEYIAFARGASPASPHDIYSLQVLQNIDATGQSGKSNEAATTALKPATPVYQINAGGPAVATGIAGQTYHADGSFFGVTVTGGTADAPAPPPVVNLLNDPGTPAAIYNTDRSGTFSYTFKSLTPNANYRLRLHLSDPANNVVGKRVFTVTVNGVTETVAGPGGTPTTGIDIVQQAQLAPGKLDGLVKDAAAGGPVAGAVITVRDFTTGQPVTPNPSPLTTAAATSPSPTGTGGPINYLGTLPKGTYIVTVTPPTGLGYSGSYTQVVNINSGYFARADFALQKGLGTVTGTVTDSTTAPVVGATLTFTDAATGVTAVSAPAAVTTDSAGSYTATVPPGNYLITATPPAGAGVATQTQQLVVTTAATPAAPLTVNFVLATGTAVGSVGGLVTDSVSALPLAGATIKVLSGATVVALIQTRATPSATPAAPNGDGNPANYLALLPTGTYSFQFSASGYAPVSQNVTVVNTPAGTAAANAFVRVDKALVNGTPNTGQNTAVLEEFLTTAPAFDLVNKDGLIVAPKGGITVSFNPVSGSPPIVQGLEILADSSTFGSSGFGDLTGTAAAAAPTIDSALGGFIAGKPQITLTFQNSFSAGTPTSFNIFRTGGTPTGDNLPPPLSPSGSEGPIPIATIPATGSFVNTFTDTAVVLGSEYYYQVSAVFTQTVTPESTTNIAVKLNTDDNPGQTSPAGNVYDDIYPTWSPFITIFSIAYSSNRTITYNDPARAGAPVETAISVGQGGSLGSGATVGASYAGLLESQLLNLDPPTLLPFSGNEVVHITDSGGNTTRTGIAPGQTVTFTVRLSSREAGIDNTGGPGGKPNVYIQVKDPDSKYQDSQGIEHKVFAKDSVYRYQPNNTQGVKMDSGTSAILMNGGSPIALDTFFGSTIGDTLNSYGSFGENLTYSGYNAFTINNFYTQFPQRGAVGGIDGPEGFATAPVGPAANKSDTISIGRSGGGINPGVPVDGKGNPVLDAGKNPLVLPGTDPARFIPSGPEFECQVVNPQYSNGTGDTIATDYVSPYYLAGLDDQQPFSGAGRQRPVTNVAGKPAEWLPLSRVPDAQQDGQGGVLYSVTWRTPISASDYYLDVIAFDKATPPKISSFGVSGQSNWRIYDNVWGFSTASTIGNNDILVVSDYALGQKFAATTFGGQQGLLNLVPKLYGAESYVTDIDVNLLPNAIFRTVLPPGAEAKNFSNYLPEVLTLSRSYNADGSGGNGSFGFSVLNGLGVGSYNDRFINDGGVVDGVAAVKAQQYSLWRILARGPVPASLYTAYEPTLQSQPAVADPGAQPKAVNVAAGTVAAANRCILWLSPYTGDVLAGPGTLTDSATQSALTKFVAAGGRLCISGQDVGSALTQGGTVNNGAAGFLSTVLGATLKTASAGTHLPVSAKAADSRITVTPFFDGIITPGNSTEQEINPGFTVSTIPAAQRQILISNNYGGNIFQSIFGPFVETSSYSGNWRTDGSLDQIGPYIQPFPVGVTNANSNTVVGQIDTITPNAKTNIHTDITLAAFANAIPPSESGNVDASSAPGGAGLIYSDNTGVGGNGSKVVYATFGLEALSTEYYKQTFNQKPNPDVYAPRNQRQQILHNIVCYLRTGSITGTVRATSGSGVVGSGVPGVTVYLQDAYGVAIPGRGTFSALTDSAGNFRIDGIEPGNYTLAAYRTGYTRTTSNPGVVFTVEGDSTQSASLTISPATPGSLSGTVTDGTNPVAGASVTFTSTDGTTVTATTDSNGKYALPSVPQGTYTGAAAKSPGYSPSQTQTVTVTGGSAQAVNFVLKAGPGTASGRVTALSGTPIAGATVSFSGGSPVSVVATATTGADGTYTATLPAGSYTVTATAPGFGTSDPKSILVTGGGSVTVPDILLGPVVNGTLGGLVTGTADTNPISGVTVTVLNPVTGQKVTATTGTVGTAPDGSGSINYGPITLASGTYTVTATKNGVTTGSQSISITGSTFTRLDFTGAAGLPPLHTFGAGLNFLSLPFDYSGSSFDALFGPLNTAPTGTTPNGTRSHVAVWNPLTNAYAIDPSAPADALRLGVGYWVFLKNGASLTQPGVAPTAASVTVALHPVWNQIGVPSTTPIPVSSLQFDTGAGTALLSFASATSSSLHVVSPTLYRYDGTAYQQVTASDTLQPYQAYWIKVFTDANVHIPTR